MTSASRLTYTIKWLGRREENRERCVDDAGFGELPPDDAWHSGNGERAYVHDMVEVPDRWPHDRGEM